MASIYHLSIPKRRFQKHSEYVVNLDKILVECVPYIDTGTTILTSLLDLLSDSHTHTPSMPWLEESTMISAYFVDAEIQQFQQSMDVDQFW